MTDEETLQDEISRYIREPQPYPRHNPWWFSKRDAANLAEATGALQEEVEQVFFNLCGTVWIGTVMVVGGVDQPAHRRMSPPPGWSRVSFNQKWMWARGTLLENRS